MAGPGPICAIEQDHQVQDGTSCLMESRQPGPIQKRSPWVWERGKALFGAYERALILAPGAIARQTGYALGEVLKGLLPGLVEMLVVVAATTGIGAAAGGIIGFFFGGAGAAPGVVVGGELGFDIGLAALTWLGVGFLAVAMVQGMGRLWSQLLLGVTHAWEAAEYPDKEYPHRIEEAAAELAGASGILMLLLLQAVVAWVLKRAAVGATQSALRTAGTLKAVGSEAAADAAVLELVTKLKGTKLGGDFATWVDENWPKLKEDPRLRVKPKPSPANAVARLEGPTKSSASRDVKPPEFTFRGDSRPPDVIFKQGFAPRGASTDILKHAIDNTDPPSAFVSTSKSPDVAANFSSNVYVVRPVNGIDVNAELGSASPFPGEQEVAIPGGVNPTDIRGVTLPEEGVSILNPNYKP